MFQKQRVLFTDPLWIENIDQSHNSRDCCIMAASQTFNRCYPLKVGWLWLKFCKALISYKVCSTITANFWQLDCLLPVLRCCHNTPSVAAMLQGHPRFVYINFCCLLCCFYYSRQGLNVSLWYIT